MSDEQKLSPVSPGKTSSTSLPIAWIERLFSRMVAMYGSRFADLWAGANQAEVKATWAEALGRFDAETLRRALDQCLKTFEYPPTLPQFFNLCKAQQPPQFTKLEAPRVPMPDYVREQLAQFKKKHTMNIDMHTAQHMVDTLNTMVGPAMTEAIIRTKR